MMVAIAEKLQGDLPMGYMDVSKSTGEKESSMGLVSHPL